MATKSFHAALSWPMAWSGAVLERGVNEKVAGHARIDSDGNLLRIMVFLMLLFLPGGLLGYLFLIKGWFG